MTPIQQLYKYFSDLMKPTGAQFRALIDSFWHKAEKIPISSIEGLDKLIEGTASDRQLQNHINDTHAHKELLDKKVDKVPGKKLTTEDFTTELRQKLEGLQQVDISLLLPRGNFTGTAQDLKDLIDGLTRILQSPDTELDELREIVAYIKQNKHILSTLGINNIAGLEEALANKADKDHNHDDRYAPITHHHNEYAYRTHRHNWDDIDGKPNNLATTENVKTAIEGIQIGGRNYVLNSKPKLTSVGYMGQYWNLSEPVVIGEQYTFSCYATIEKERILCVYFIDVSGQPRQYIIDKLVNGYNKFTVIPNYAWSGLCVFYEVLGISPTPTATIEKLKFEKGNKPTDWSPAPEDAIPVPRAGAAIGSNWTAVVEHQNNTIFVENSLNIELNQLQNMGSISFIKTFDAGAVTFTCAGKNIIYPFDNQFNGKKGSTAVVSIHDNDCYIRISNV